MLAVPGWLDLPARQPPRILAGIFTADEVLHDPVAQAGRVPALRPGHRGRAVPGRYRGAVMTGNGSRWMKLILRTLLSAMTPGSDPFRNKEKNALNRLIELSIGQDSGSVKQDLS